MKRLLAVGLALATLPAYADTWVSATTVSYHLDREQRFNERNPGLGIEHGLTENTRAVAGFYKNSIYRESAYVGASWAPLIAGNVRAGVVGGVITGYRISPAPMLVPVLMVEGKRIGANILFVPPVIKDVPATFALQLKIKVD
jgi:hypothetical protein